MRRRRKKGGPRRPNRKFSLPKWEYIYGLDRPSIRQLAERWKGVPGCSLGQLDRLCKREEWRRLRDDSWERIEREAAERMEQSAVERRTKAVQEASGRHVQVGKLLQGHGAKNVQIADSKLLDKDQVEKLSPTDLQRAGARMMVDGVTVERKGLGLEDQVVNVYFARDITVKLLLVVQKFVTDPVVYRSIKRGFRDLVAGEEEKVQEMVEGEPRDGRGKFTKE